MGRGKTLITRGDDLGSTKASVMAFRDAFENGIMKNASVMSCCRYIGEAAEVMSHFKDLCVGIHLTMNAEWDNLRWGPLLPPDQVPSLVDENGEFLKTTMKLFENRPSVEEILKEADAQLDGAVRHGFDIRYADEHMVFSWTHPDLKQALLDWCKKKGLIYADDLNRPLERPEDFQGDPVERVIESLKMADDGIYAFIGHPLFNQYDAAELGFEGVNREEIVQERDWDRRIFTDKRMLDFIEKEQIKTVRYDEL